MDRATVQEQHEHEAAYQALLERMQALGYQPDAAAFGITWSQLVILLAGIVCRQSCVVANLADDCLDECLRRAADALQNQELLPWEWTAQGAMEAVVSPAVEPDNDDEGPLTEEYENWSRVEDGWLESAYEERFDFGDF